MKIQLNTDNNIVGSESLTADVEKKITHSLNRFADKVTRVEVHLSDLNSTKAGPADKRCVIEARVAGLQPTSVSHEAATIAQAIDGAREKMATVLDTTFGKRSAAKHDQVVPAEDTDI